METQKIEKRKLKRFQSTNDVGEAAGFRSNRLADKAAAMLNSPGRANSPPSTDSPSIHCSPKARNSPKKKNVEI
jgi:hypothetical protein